MGYPKIDRGRGYWQNLENIFKEAEEVMIRHNLNDLPGKQKIKKNGVSWVS